MKHSIKKNFLCLSLIAAALAFSACSSTRTENGVTIEQDRGLNPLNYIPSF